MLKGMHAMFYTEKADETRAFFRDKFQFPFTDVGDGWLIFDPPAADFGCHPSERQFHDISFWCEDIENTVAELRERGVEFVGDLEDQGFGLCINFKLPDGQEVLLYEPKYAK